MSQIPHTPQGIRNSSYFTVTFSEVDIFGYAPDFATDNFTVHVVFRFGATSRPDTKEHNPDSDQVFLPFDGVVMIRDKVVRDPFFTVEIKTLNPGRTEIFIAVDKSPVLERTSTLNV